MAEQATLHGLSWSSLLCGWGSFGACVGPLQFRRHVLALHIRVIAVTLMGNGSRNLCCRKAFVVPLPGTDQVSLLCSNMYLVISRRPRRTGQPAAGLGMFRGRLSEPLLPKGLCGSMAKA